MFSTFYGQNYADLMYVLPSKKTDDFKNIYQSEYVVRKRLKNRKVKKQKNRTGFSTQSIKNQDWVVLISKVCQKNEIATQNMET